jgi:hypothetical protein
MVFCSPCFQPVFFPKDDLLSFARMPRGLPWGGFTFAVQFSAAYGQGVHVAEGVLNPKKFLRMKAGPDDIHQFETTDTQSARTYEGDPDVSRAADKNVETAAFADRRSVLRGRATPSIGRCTDSAGSRRIPVCESHSERGLTLCVILDRFRKG